MKLFEYYIEYYKHLTPASGCLHALFVALVMLYAHFWGERRERAIRNFCRRHPLFVVITVIVIVDTVTMAITGPENFPSFLYAVLAVAAGMTFSKSFRGKPAG